MKYLKIDNFLGKSKLNFWIKNEGFEQCVLESVTIYFGAKIQKTHKKYKKKMKMPKHQKTLKTTRKLQKSKKLKTQKTLKIRKIG